MAIVDLGFGSAVSPYIWANPARLGWCALRQALPTISGGKLHRKLLLDMERPHDRFGRALRGSALNNGFKR